MSTGVTSSRNRMLMWLVKWRLRSENMKNFVNKEKLNKEPTKIIITNKTNTLVRSPRSRQRWKKSSVSRISSKRQKHALKKKQQLINSDKHSESIRLHSMLRQMSFARTSSSASSVTESLLFVIQRSRTLQRGKSSFYASASKSNRGIKIATWSKSIAISKLAKQRPALATLSSSLLLKV